MFSFFHFFHFLNEVKRDSSAESIKRLSISIPNVSIAGDKTGQLKGSLTVKMKLLCTGSTLK